MDSDLSGVGRSSAFSKGMAALFVVLRAQLSTLLQTPLRSSQLGCRLRKSANRVIEIAPAGLCSPATRNAGHQFSDAPEGGGVIGWKLSEEERMQIIEYLKTL